MLPFSYFLRALVRLAVALVVATSGLLANEPVLRVQDSNFLLNGKPMHLIGVNYFDAFQAMLDESKPRSEAETAALVVRYTKGLEFLHAHQIPFIRFAATGYFPIDWHLYRESPDEYYRRLDAFIGEAEKQKIGIIPSLFWAFFTVPDLCGEPISAWGQAGSKTRQFMRKFTREFVSRYRSRQIIWGWEFGNEYLCETDLPGKVSQQWAIPARGSPGERTEADKLRYEDIVEAYADFGRTVRALDPVRPIFTGDTIPRHYSWHLNKKEGWKPDTVEQYEEMLQRANPAPVDTIGLHIYHWKADNNRSGYGIANRGPEAVLEAAARVGARTGQPIWLGEFGCKVGEPDLAKRKTQMQEMLDLIVKYKVQLSAYWVFDSLNPAIWMYNLAPGNQNAFVLDQIAAANRLLAKPTHE